MLLEKGWGGGGKRDEVGFVFFFWYFGAGEMQSLYAGGCLTRLRYERAGMGLRSLFFFLFFFFGINEYDVLPLYEYDEQAKNSYTARAGYDEQARKSFTARVRSVFSIVCNKMSSVLYLTKGSKKSPIAFRVSICWIYNFSIFLVYPYTTT